MSDDTVFATTLRVYARVQLGLKSEDEAIRNAAISCLSYLTYHLDKEYVVLPPHIAVRYRRLPED